MSKEQIKQLIEDRTDQDGLTETGIEGVRLFRATQPIPCVPAVYEPSVVAIVSGAKEAVLDRHRYVYDNSRYLCCPMSMPVKAGTEPPRFYRRLFSSSYATLTTGVMFL